VTKQLYFAEQAAGSQMGPKIMRQNVHISLNGRQDITNGLKNHTTNIQISLQERADIVSLPQGWIQEIKCMYPVLLMHGFFYNLYTK
jgi:hypothetical protein